MSNQTIETRVGIISWEDKAKGILYSHTKNNSILTVEDAIELDEIFKNNFPHPHRTLLSDIANLKSLTKEARDYYAGTKNVYDYFDAIAVLSDSKFSVANITIYTFLLIIPHKKPIKIFYNKQDAIQWLLSITAKKKHH